MSVLEWVVIGQVLIFVITLVVSCHLLSKHYLWPMIEPTEEGIYEPLQDCPVESLIEEKK